MGDLESLIEKIHSVTDEKKQKKIQEKLQEGKLSLEDVIEQVKSMNSLGGFDKMFSMIPGMNKTKINKDQLITQEEKIKRWEHILKSMTKEEKENPGIIQKQTSRIGRIAKGAGVNNSDVRALIKQYDMLNSMIKESSGMDMSQGMSQKQMQKIMKKMARGMKGKIKF
jgi:signal recognition particle subunit SRP54